MRKIFITASAAAFTLSFLLPFELSKAYGQNRARLKQENSKDGFPGVGDYDNWKASAPEVQAGMSMMKVQKWDNAIAHFRAALALYEYQPHVWLEIGRAIEKKDGNIKDAENAYRQSLKLSSQSWQAWHKLANVLYVQKRYAEAREAISNALNLNPPVDARNNMDKLVIAIDSAQHNADTGELNQSQ